MQLSPHFSLEEFTRSSTAERAGIDNTLPTRLLDAAKRTADMHERIRAKLCELAGHDVPMHPSSGYRCPALNWTVRYPLRGPGVDSTGDHPLAAAMDWHAPAFGTPREICEALVPFVDELLIGQLIYEHSWVHTSTNTPALAVNRIITKVVSGYSAGIVA